MQLNTIYIKMRKRDKFLCECGLKHNISDKNIRENKFRRCPVNGSLPPKEDIERVTKEKILRKFN